MSREPCDGCGRQVTVGSASTNLWVFDQQSTDALVVELADGTEHLLCHACLDRLPEDREVTAADIERLPDHDGGKRQGEPND